MPTSIPLAEGFRILVVPASIPLPRMVGALGLRASPLPRRCTGFKGWAQLTPFPGVNVCVDGVPNGTPETRTLTPAAGFNRHVVSAHAV